MGRTELEIVSVKATQSYESKAHAHEEEDQVDLYIEIYNGLANLYAEIITS